MTGPGKTIECLTAERLEELAREPQNVVYTPTHDITYTPWSGERVAECVKKLVALTRRGVPAAEIRRADPDIEDFANKYTVFFAKLTDPAFAADASHVRTVLELVQLKTMVDNGVISAADAQSRSATLALVNLQKRVAASKRDR